MPIVFLETRKTIVVNLLVSHKYINPDSLKISRFLVDQV